MKLNKLIVIAAVSALVCGAMAQGGGGGRGGQRGQRGGQGFQMTPSSLIRRADVQKDLALSDEQKTKLTDINTASRQKRTDAMTAAGDDPAARRAAGQKVAEEIAKETTAVLTADQQKRLKEIFIQVAGPRAILDKDVQSDLAIDDAQKGKITDLQKRQAAANQEIQTKVQNQEIDAAAAREQRTKNEGVMKDEVEKILTDAQKSKLKDMAGKHFEAEPQRARGGGGGGGRRRGGGI